MLQRQLNFVVGGAQKAGTTTLDAILRLHPGIQMARVKETHFFDDERRGWHAPDYRDLDAYFPLMDERLRGEATPITMFWRPAIRRLHAYNPDMKFILLLRNPITRAFSQWRHSYAAGYETLAFEAAIRGAKTGGRRSVEAEELHRSASYVERGLYSAQLSYIHDHFDSSQVHCEIAEEFHSDQPAGLQRIARFLEIDPFPAGITNVRLHTARPVAYPSTLGRTDIAYLAAAFADDVAALESLLGRPIDIWRDPAGALPEQARA